MSIPIIELEVEGLDSEKANYFHALIRKSVDAAVLGAKLEFDENAELSVLLAGNETLQDLNNKWRGLNQPTNVLSFPGQDIEIGEKAGMFIGDIAISLEKVVEEAEQEKKSQDDHFCHLVIHGFLHLFGYDHETERQAEEMEGLEVAILAEMGISNPYESIE